jgi:hypothetical protein
MNRLLLAAALILAAAAGATAEEKVKTKTPAQAVGALLAYTPPKDWSASAYTNAEGADPVVRFERLSDAIVIRVFGASGSAYATPKDFLAGPAGSEQGAAADAAGAAVVAGQKLELHRRSFSIEAPDPHRPSPGRSLKGSEVYAVLPLKKGRFAVLAYRRESPIPDLERAGEKAWAAFLKTIRPRK